MNNKESFDFYKKAGLLNYLTAERRVETLVNMLLDALFIPVANGETLIMVDRQRLEHFGVNASEPINFGDLKCVSVEEENGVFKVTVEEAAPNECPTLCEYIEKYMATYGWAVSVETEW